MIINPKIIYIHWMYELQIQYLNNISFSCFMKDTWNNDSVHQERYVFTNTKRPNKIGILRLNRISSDHNKKSAYSHSNVIFVRFFVGLIKTFFSMSCFLRNIYSKLMLLSVSHKRINKLVAFCEYMSRCVFWLLAQRITNVCVCVCVRQNTCSDRFDMARLIIISFYLTY